MFETCHINQYKNTMIKALFISMFTITISNAQHPIKEKRGDIISRDDIVIATNNNPDSAREYPLVKSFTPILGYIQTGKGGAKGLEKYADEYLREGYNVHLNIDASLQESTESILDKYKKELQADEIIAAVMESGTGRIRAIVSSNRYDPADITQDDIYSLNSKVSEYPYEPGSLITPLTLAIALENKLIKPDTFIETYNGILHLGGKYTITDGEKFSYLTATDIIVHSSNVGITQISWLMDAKTFRDGLTGFGLGSPSGIDLSRELGGHIKPLDLLQNKLHRASQSYGYGMSATLVQLLKAYSIFSNDGIAVTPAIIDYYEGYEKTIVPDHPKPYRVISKNSARQMQDILREVVKRGTGTNVAVPGLDIGGKTGTAHIASEKGYTRQYHSSFFGFANDDSGNRYMIGVLVIKPKKPNYHFASRSAVPVFREIVKEMVEEGDLVPE